MSIDWILSFALLGIVALVSVYALIYLPVQTHRDFRRMLSALRSCCGDTRGSYQRQCSFAGILRGKDCAAAPSTAFHDSGHRGCRSVNGDRKSGHSLCHLEQAGSPDRRRGRGFETAYYDRAEDIGAGGVDTALAPFIRHHHENWDGSGYPDGLQGEEIPLASRILHVVDDFVVTMRGKPLDNVAARWQAVQQMEHHVGRKYDPRVFEAFRPIVRKEVFDRINHCHLSDA